MITVFTSISYAQEVAKRIRQGPFQVIPICIHPEEIIKLVLDKWGRVASYCEGTEWSGGEGVYTDKFESQIPHSMCKFNNSTTPKHTHTHVNESHKNFQQVLASQMPDSP